MMKLNKILKGVLLALAVVCGISLYVALNNPYQVEAAQFTTLRTIAEPALTRPGGYVVIMEDRLAGSTAVALEVPETERWNIQDYAHVRWESASDVWSYGATSITIKDSDSDGYIDWVEFTATGGATAGGLVQVFGINDTGWI